MRNWNKRTWLPLGKSRIFLFILPMRNWNVTKAWPIATFNSLFILPMRNWNSHKTLLYTQLLAGNFLYYLWGIETLVGCELLPHKLSFYITYEELKHYAGRNVFIITVNFLYYLWGIETQLKPVTWQSFLSSFLYYLWGIETNR